MSSVAMDACSSTSINRPISLIDLRSRRPRPRPRPARPRHVHRVARLDLVGRRAEVWCEAQIDIFAPDFDGAQWVVARGARLFVIDALESRFEALAELSAGGHGDGGGALSPPAVVTSGRDDLAARVRYELPRLAPARPQAEGSGGHPAVRVHAVAASSGLAAVYLAQSMGEGAAKPPLLVLGKEGSSPRNAVLPWSTGVRALAVCARPGWIAGAVQSAAGVEVRLIDEPHLITRFILTLYGASRASLRLSDDALIVADDRGRAIVVGLDHGHLLHDAARLGHRKFGAIPGRYGPGSRKNRRRPPRARPPSPYRRAAGRAWRPVDPRG